MNWFKKKPNVPFKIDAIEVSAKNFPMHILGLNPWTGQGYKLLATQLKDDPTFFLPTIVKDGRFSLLSVPDEKSYLELLNGIRIRALQLPDSTISRMAVGAGVCLNPQKPAIDAFPYEVIGFSQVSTELVQIFSTLQLFTSSLSLFQASVEALQKEPIRTWINRTIENYERELNWTENITRQVREHKGIFRL